jgi:hypothetical protein
MRTYSLILLALGQMITGIALGQCEHKKYCEDLMEDYDYRSQSSFAKLSPGDTASVNVVLYGGQKYRFFVGNDPDLGNVTWKVVQPERKTKRTIQKIKKDTMLIYQTNDNGDFVADKNGALIIKDKHVNIDTTWLTERISTEKVLFDNKQSGKQPFYETQPEKSARYIVKINIPSGDKNYSGCVNVYVGRKVITGKNFIKKGSVSKKEH